MGRAPVAGDEVAPTAGLAVDIRLAHEIRDDHAEPLARQEQVTLEHEAVVRRAERVRRRFYE
jgi:hypothetical protein